MRHNICFIQKNNVKANYKLLCKVTMLNLQQQISLICTMLLEQIKGFYHGITKIFLLVGSYTMLSWHF